MLIVNLLIAQQFLQGVRLKRTTVQPSLLLLMIHFFLQLRALHVLLEFEDGAT